MRLEANRQVSVGSTDAIKEARGTSYSFDGTRRSIIDSMKIGSLIIS